MPRARALLDAWVRWVYVVRCVDAVQLCIVCATHRPYIPGNAGQRFNTFAGTMRRGRCAQPGLSTAGSTARNVRSIARNTLRRIARRATIQRPDFQHR
jgi:hypothetical protein